MTSLEIKNVILEQMPKDVCFSGLTEFKGVKQTTGMFKIFKKYIDFCLNNNIPSPEFLKSEFSDKYLLKQGIVIDQHLSIDNVPFLVLYKTSNVKVTFTDFFVSEIFLIGESRINLIAKDESYIIIDAFDESFVNVETTGNARVLLNLYAGATATYSGNVIVKYKKRKKY